MRAPENLDRLKSQSRLVQVLGAGQSRSMARSHHQGTILPAGKDHG